MSYSTLVYITVTRAANILLVYVWLIFMEGTSSNFNEQFDKNSLAHLRV